MTSVRDFLDAVGRAVSIREAAQASGQPLPRSLRNFVGAPPPGRALRKVISLDLLQRKLDEFLNKRSRPPFLVQLDGAHFGASTATVTFDDPVRGYDHDPFTTYELAGPGEELEFPGILFGTHRFFFRDDRLSVGIASGQPLMRSPLR